MMVAVGFGGGDDGNGTYVILCGMDGWGSWFAIA